jgi:hypothetical protein
VQPLVAQTNSGLGHAELVRMAGSSPQKFPARAHGPPVVVRLCPGLGLIGWFQSEFVMVYFINYLRTWKLS